MQFGPDKAGRISSHGIFFDGKSGICPFLGGQKLHSCLHRTVEITGWSSLSGGIHSILRESSRKIGV